MAAPPVLRTAAAAYLASFLARAAFVPPGMVLEALGAQLQWARVYLQARVQCSAGIMFFVQFWGCKCNGRMRFRTYRS